MQTLAQWLEERCKKESLSLRQAGVRTGLSHATIADIIKGSNPDPETIRKLAQAFSTGGEHHRLALEDHLLALAGYRTPRGREETSMMVAHLMDKVEKFNEPQIKMMIHFADYLTEIVK